MPRSHPVKDQEAAGARPSRFARRPGPNADPLQRVDDSSAFDPRHPWRPAEWQERVLVVLYEPTDAVNVGTVVRAMGNTGFSRLRLVRPAPIRDWDVTGVAHYTQHILDRVQRFESVFEAVRDTHLVVGLTGKHHRDPRNATPFAEVVDDLATRAAAGQTVALLFGREDFGLSNDALDACHRVTTIPTNPAYPSLNLAQAALLTLYPLFQRAGGGDQLLRHPRRVAPPASTAELEDLFLDLERALAAVEFFKVRSRTGTMRSIRAALARASLDRRESALLRAAMIEIRRYLRRKGLLDQMGPVGRGNVRGSDES